MSKLALAIPTFNRANVLYQNILNILDDLIVYNISVYISDDSIDRDTEIMISSLQSKYNKIFYVSNKPSLGHDFNCLNTLFLPTEEYIWYLGDSIVIDSDQLKNVYEIVNSDKYDFIFCNAKSRAFNITKSVYVNSPIEIFENLSWHLTMTGATIYKRKVLHLLDNFDVSKYKNFPQTAIIFELLAKYPLTCFWIDDKIISSALEKKSYWFKKVFEVFFEDFSNLMNNLPAFYPPTSKEFAIASHSQKSGIFTYHSLVKFRIANVYNYETYLKYKDSLVKYTIKSKIILLLISVTPKFILKFVYHYLFLSFNQFKKINK